MEPGLSGSFSGSFQGDGSNLTGVGGGTPTFIGSGSTSASADPNNGVVINASGSTLFDVRGSLGSLFSVTDSFEGNLFEVNNISGISLLTVSSSGDVDIPKGKLTVSSSVSASQFLGDGSQLTGVEAFPFTGDAQITGSLTISSSFVDFSGLTDIKTRRFAITSDHVSGQTVTSASFYDSFVEALDASTDGDTLHVFSNDSSSITNDIFEGKNITIVGNGFHFDVVGAGTNNHRWTFTSCSIDVYDFEFRRTPASNLSNFDTSVWEIKGPSNWHFYNSGFAATKNAHALMIEGNNINIDGVYARLTDSTSYLTYAIYKDTTTNDFTLENFDIHSEAGGIFAQGDRVKIENGNIDYSTTIDRSNAITITGHTGSISNVNILGNDDNNQNVALKIDPTTSATNKGITFIENVNIRSGEITVQNDAHVIIGDCKVFNIQQRSNNVYFAGTGSITNCNIEYDERMGGYTSGGAGIQLHTDQEVRISNCHVYGFQFGLENQYPENIITVYDSYFETGLSYSGNGRGIYGLDTKTATIVGCQGVINESNGQGYGLDLQTTGSGKIHIVNSDFINKGPASSYGQCFKLIGSPANNEIYVSDVNIILDTPNNNSGTSRALNISGVTGSYFNNLYVEGYAAGTFNAISSSIVNSTFYQKHLSPGATGTVFTLNAAGNDNLYSNCTFEVDPEYNAYTADPIVTVYNTQRFHNSTFKGGKKSNFALTGSGDANVELVGNRFINILTGITASNVTDITTGYIDGKGNWEKTQTTSSFDHIEATSFKGDGSQLTGISTTPFPFTGDAQITGSLVISASNNTSESLSIEGSGSTIFSIQGSQGQLFSVTDDLLDEVFSVADISGDTLLSVSGSGLVTIPVGDLSGSATATASYGAFKGDGSQLTNLPASSAFPFTGDAQITGSLIVSSSGITSIGSITSSGITSNLNYVASTGGTGATGGSGFNIEGGYGTRLRPTYLQIYSGALLQSSAAGRAYLGSTVNTNASGPNTMASRLAILGLNTYSTDAATSSFGLSVYDGQYTNTGGTKLFHIRDDGEAFFSGSVVIRDQISSSLTVQSSGSTLFEVIGSEGTIFKLDDDLDGTLFTVNDRSGIPMFEVSASGRIVAEEGESIIRSQRPMVTHTADFNITSSLDFAGKYHIVGGDLTCSINTSSIVPAGAEFEFFQTSSAGNFLYTTASHVDLIVKNDNLNLAGRGSGATLKYIGGSTFHLVGDLT